MHDRLLISNAARTLLEILNYNIMYTTSSKSSSNPLSAIYSAKLPPDLRFEGKSCDAVT